MTSPSETRLIAGAAGQIEVFVDRPPLASRGFALVAHPHPLFGGTADNKVVQTLARALVSLNYTVARPNFRGVGASQGSHDAGRGETDDLLAVIAALDEGDPKERVLAGFSFGAFVQTKVAERLAAHGTGARRLVLVGLAVTNFAPAPVPVETLLIHGESDTTVPLSAVLDWARPQDLAVTVVPGADHFFHRRLTVIKRLVLGGFLGLDAPLAQEA